VRILLYVLLLATTVVATRARAQAVVGFGDDATVPPRGVVRIGFQNIWTRFDQRFEAASGASITTRAQSRATPVFLDIGVLDRLSIGGMIPSYGTKEIATYFPETASSIHADSVRAFDQMWVGDAEAWAKFVWLGALPEKERVRPRGVKIRSAVTALARIGTGRPPPPTQQFGVGTGTGATALELRSQWDFLFGRLFWTSVAGRYGHYFADQRPVRVAPVGDPFATDVGPVEARRQLGGYYEVEATPRLVLGHYFSIGAQYRYRHKMRDSYSAVTPGTSPDPAILDAGSELTDQRVGFGVVYSTIAAREEHHAAFPVEVSFQYFRTVSASGVHPSPSQYAVGVRLWGRVWGGGRKQEAGSRRQ
jgi:hypothetical protein